MRLSKHFIAFLVLITFLTISFFLFSNNSVTTKQIQASTGSATINLDAEWSQGPANNILVSANNIVINNKTVIESEYHLESCTSIGVGDPSNLIDGNINTSITLYNSDNPPNMGISPRTGDYFNCVVDGERPISKISIYTVEDESTLVQGVLTYKDLSEVWHDEATGFGTTAHWTINPISIMKLNEIKGTNSTTAIAEPTGFLRIGEVKIYTETAIATHTSAATQLDAGDHDTVAWTTFVPSATSPANTSLSFKFRTSTDATDWSAWSAPSPYAASIDLSGLTQQRYLQVETTLINTDGLSTPTLDNYTANYDYTDAPAETCLDGIQNQGETGVDCGGPCSACPVTPTCEDGVQNGGETGIDCGGTCTACPVAPTCEDGIQNGTETGVDCGGSCAVCVPDPTCVDGIQNGNETGTDCGGSCGACPVPPTCDDGIQNGSETNTDCGGSCAACVPDPTCNDGIQNGSETAADCGGSCTACPIEPPPIVCSAADMIVKTLSPNGGESYQLTGQMNLGWLYGNSSTSPPAFPNLSQGQKSQVNDVPVGVVLSTDGGNSYDKLLSVLFPDNKFNTISPENEIYVQEAANKYGGLKPYTTRNKYVAALVETQGYYTYSLTIPDSRTLITDNARIKLVPINFGCQKITNDASDNNFKITAKTLPAVPKSIAISVTPDPSYLKPSQTQQYTARIVDQENKDITGTCPVTWSMQTPSAGSINSDGLLTATSSLGVWNNAIKAEAKCAGLTDFSLLTFATTNEARRLTYVWANPWSAAVQEPVKNTIFDVWGYDQFNLVIKSGIDYSFSLLDKRIGTIPTNGRVVNIATSQNYGCYPNKIESTATYKGVTKSSYGSISIHPAKLSLTNGCGDLSAKIFTALTGTKTASAAEGQVFSSVSYAAPKYLRPGQTTQFGGVPRDQSWTPIGGVKVEYILKDSNAGQLASNGKFIASSNPGSYFGAIEIRATKGDKVISATFDVIVTAEKRKAGSIHAWGPGGASELYNSKIMKLSKTGYYSFYSYLRDQFGDTAAGNFDVRLEDVSGQNLINILGTTTVRAKGKEGVFKNALKVTYDIESLNSRIAEERDKVEGPSPVLYLTLDISDKNDDPSACIKKGDPICDPLDPACVSSCVGEECNTPCTGDSCSSCTGPFCFITNLIKKDFSNTSKSLMALVAAALIALAISALNLVSNFLSIIQGYRIFSFFAKGVDKKNAKGVTYDAFSGLPIPNAKVMLINDKRGVDSIAVSDREGKFSLPVNPGQSYQLKIEKEGFALFDNDVREKNGFLKYELKLAHNYFGEEYFAGDEEFFFSKNIPLIPSADSLKLAKKTKLSENFSRALIILNSVIILVGTIFSALALSIDPSWFNISIFSLYILLLLFYALKYFLYTGRSYGTVRKDTGEPVELALVRALRAKDGKLFKTVATDRQGRFGLALPKGYYKIYCSKQGLKQQEDVELLVRSNLKPIKLELTVERFEVTARQVDEPTTPNITGESSNTPGTQTQTPETYPHFDQPVVNSSGDFGYSEVDLSTKNPGTSNRTTLTEGEDDRYMQDASQIIENYKAL